MQKAKVGMRVVSETWLRLLGDRVWARSFKASERGEWWLPARDCLPRRRTALKGSIQGQVGTLLGACPWPPDLVPLPSHPMSPHRAPSSLPWAARGARRSQTGAWTLPVLGPPSGLPVFSGMTSCHASWAVELASPGSNPSLFTSCAHLRRFLPHL